MRQCVLPHEQGQILGEAHTRVAGGHYGGQTTACKVLRIEIWWTTLHNNVVDYARSYDFCQHVGKPSQQDEMALVPHVTLQPFDKWVVDFVGPINPSGKRTSVWYIH